MEQSFDKLDNAYRKRLGLYFMYLFQSYLDQREKEKNVFN